MFFYFIVTITMEFIIFIAIIIIISIISAIFSWVADLIDKRKKAIRDEVANNILRSRNIRKEIDNCNKRLEYINHKAYDIVNREVDYINPIVEDSFLNNCPNCKKGSLVIRGGKYGKFIGCSRFPDCRFTKNYKKEVYKYNKYANESIINELKKIYL